MTSFETLPRIDSGIDFSLDGSETLQTGRNLKSRETSFASLSIASEDNSQQIEEETKTWRQKYWPPRGWPAKWLTWFLVLAAIYGSVWSVFPKMMEPNKKMFGLVLTILLCIAAEQLVVKIPTPKGLPPLPPLLASLLMGLALRNIPGINIAAYIDEEMSSILREMALTVILTRAGLEIEPEAMKKVKWAVVRLAFTPCLVETTLIGVVGHFILGFPYVWSFMTGFMIAAVSPAVVVPSLIILQEVGYGVEKGVPSLVMAASGIDDVLAIAGFTVFLGLAIPTGIEEEIVNTFSAMFGFSPPDSLPNSVSDLAVTSTTGYLGNGTEFPVSQMNYSTTQANDGGTNTIGKDIVFAIIQVIIGVVAGLVLGFFISYVPHRSMRYKSFCRGALLLLIGILFVFGTAVWGIPGSGALCALIMSFTASMHWKEEAKPLAVAWHYMWVVFQPILFGLTGALVDVRLMDAETVGLGLATLGIAIIGRLMTSTLVTFGLNFNLKEKLFVSISWIPKGTVQAALGSVALEEAIRWQRPQTEIHYGEQILVLAVLITLITAPIGGFGIALAGPRLLAKKSEFSSNPQDNEAYVGTENDSGGKSDLENYNENTKDGRESSSERKHSVGLELKIKDPSLERIDEEDDGREEEIHQDPSLG